jgi:hypothetical protein
MKSMVAERGHLPEALAKELNRISMIDDKDELRRLLTQLLGITVENIVKVAAAVRRLEELGDDLSDMEISILPQIRKVAYGQIVPDLLVRFQGYPSLLRKLTALPIPDQKRMAALEPVKVLESGGDHRMVPPLRMTNGEINQVFAADHIRDDAEQAAWLRSRAETRPRAAVVAEDEIVTDMKLRGIWVGRTFIPATALANYLSQLTAKTRRGRL